LNNIPQSQLLADEPLVRNRKLIRSIRPKGLDPLKSLWAELQQGSLYAAMRASRASFVTGLGSAPWRLSCIIESESSLR